MNVVFRVDATKNIGLGHLMRCYALSEELISRGHNCFFLSNIEDDMIYKKIQLSESEIIDIKTSPKSKKDLYELIDFSKKFDIDWIVTDHYDVYSNYIKELKEHNFKVLSVDDTSQIYYYSDIVVNQNIGSEKLNFKSEEYAKFLLGTKYVMLRDELLRRGEKKYNDRASTVLVTFGGIDYDNVTLRILRGLDGSIDRDLELLVVIGPLTHVNEKFTKKINELKHDNIQVISSPENMKDLYLKSDIALSAGGSSCYELAYFGIPNIIISVANNQLNISEVLDRKKVSLYLDRKEEISIKKMKKAFQKLISDNSLRKKMSENGRKLVDGNGKKRIVDFMLNY